jgi:GDSL-like Lipase/Acylhydrolase family
MRKLLLLLLLGASFLLVAILAEPGGSRRPWSPFALVCLSAYLVFLGALALSVATYRKHTALIQNAWLALLTSGISLVALDAVAQRLKDVNRYARILPDPVVHHRLWPETTTRLQSEDFLATLQVNRYGLRGKEPEIPKPKGTYRLLMLGDSFTMGEGVSDAQPFPAILERSLASRLPLRLEVLNAGVDSYSPILSYLDLRENLLRLEPDAVVLSLDMSDLLQEQYYRSLAIYGPGGEILAVPNRRLRGRMTDWMDDWIKRNLYFLRFVYLKVRQRLDPEEGMERVIQRRNGDLLAYTLVGDALDRSQQWRDLFDSIVRIRRLCQHKGILFLLSVYPWGHQVSGSEWLPGRYYWMPPDAVASDRVFDTIRQECVDHGISLIDTVPAFRSYHGDKPLFFRHDMHWTPEGHQVMSEALREPLLQAILADLRSRVATNPGSS